MRSIFEPFCTVMAAHNPQEAFAVCEKRPPDLVISNLQLPYENGDILLLSLLRKGTRRMQMVPFIIFTPVDGTRPQHVLEADGEFAMVVADRRLHYETV